MGISTRECAGPVFMASNFTVMHLIGKDVLVCLWCGLVYNLAIVSWTTHGAWEVCLFNPLANGLDCTMEFIWMRSHTLDAMQMLRPRFFSQFRFLRIWKEWAHSSQLRPIVLPAMLQFIWDFNLFSLRIYLVCAKLTFYQFTIHHRLFFILMFSRERDPPFDILIDENIFKLFLQKGDPESSHDFHAW